MNLSALFFMGILIGWLFTGAFQSWSVHDRSTPTAVPAEKSPGPGQYINRYGERIMRTV